MTKRTTLRFGKTDKDIGYVICDILKNEHTGLSISQIIHFICKDEMNGVEQVLVEIGYDELINYEVPQARFSYSAPLEDVSWLEEQATILGSKPGSITKQIIRKRISIVPGNTHSFNLKVLERYRFSMFQKSTSSQKPHTEVFEGSMEKNIDKEKKSVIEPNKTLKTDLPKNNTNTSIQKPASQTDQATDAIMDKLLGMTMGGFR